MWVETLSTVMVMAECGVGGSCELLKCGGGVAPASCLLPALRHILGTTLVSWVVFSR